MSISLLDTSVGDDSHLRSVCFSGWGIFDWVRPLAASPDPYVGSWQGSKKKHSLRGFMGVRPSDSSPDPRAGPFGGE